MNDPGLLMHRRDLLTGLAVLVFIPLSGCTLLRNEDDLESLFTELNSLIALLPTEERREAQSVTTSMEDTARQLLALHRDFLESFNSSSADRAVATDNLRQMTVAYSEQRVALRNKLLYLQDDLHRALPESTWAEASRILNKTGQAVAPPTSRAS